MNNIYVDTDEGRKAKLKKIPEEASLVVDFAEIEKLLNI